MDTPPSSEDARRRWQQEADLLAEGRELLENMSAATRYRYLYPAGPSLGLLLAAYQEFDRMRAVGRVRGGRWRRWRAFKAVLKRHIRADMLDRSRRLSFRYPPPRLRRLPTPPPLVQRAISAVDQDVRSVVEAHVGTSPAHHGAIPGAAARGANTAASRGMGQFRDALMNEALSHPESIPALHPQYLWLLSSMLPTKRRHPIATALFVKLPLQLVLLVFTILNLAYVTAYYTFNDETLGDFVSDNVSGLLEGELRLGSIHWEGRLIFDLLTGTPSYVVVEDVDVYEPYKSIGRGRQGRAAHADRIEATLVLHEIIPWNRLGIPTLFEIPWVLHFEDVQVQEPIWFHVREYDETLADGSEVRYVGLRDAFRLYEPNDIVRRGLSFAVDDAALTDVVVDVDFSDTAGWRTAAHMDAAEFDLAFEAPDPHTAVPMELPFEFELAGHGDEGMLHVAGLDIPLSDIDAKRFASNKPGIPGGGVLYLLEARGAGSLISIQGTLRDVFSRLFDDGPDRPAKVELYAYSEDIGRFAEHLVDELALPPHAIEADGVEASASIVGPLYDPVYTLSASGLTLDLLGEPAWAMDDVTASVSMATIVPPAPWTDRFGPGEKRRVVTFEALDGTALDGSFELRKPAPEQRSASAPPAQIIVPLDASEPLLASVPLRVTGVNAGQLVPDDPETGEILRGVASGDVNLRRLVFGPLPPPADAPPGDEPDVGVVLADIDLGKIRLVRDRGPADDGFPKSIGLDGAAVLGPGGVVDLEDLDVTTDGARLQLQGGVDPSAERFKRLLWNLQISDGRAFARSFALPDYFERLDARMAMTGPFRSPTGSDGRLSIAGVGSAKLGTQASMWMDGGELHLRAPDAYLFGGHGRVDADIQIFERGGISKNPSLRAYIDLEGVELSDLVGDTLSGRADVELEIGDGEGRPARASELRVHGTATAKTLAFGGTTYRNASVSFRLTSDEVAVERLVLPIHRPVSPKFAKGVTVQVGQIVAEGTVSLERNPDLDLLVEAEGVPLSVVSRLLDVESPLRGQIGEGTRFTVGGSLTRPSVEGSLALQGVSAQGIALGSGTLEFTSADFAADGPLAAHRELRVVGELATARRRDRMQWTVDGVAAFGAPQRRGAASPEVPVAAQLDIVFDQLDLPTLLRDPADPLGTAPVDGELKGLSALVLTCNPGTPMLSDCLKDDGKHTVRSLEIELELDEAWVRSAATPLPSGVTPCASKTTLCSDGPLLAEVHWPMLELKEPWRLETGGAGGAAFELSGSFDLASPPATPKPTAAQDAKLSATCRPPPVAGRTVAGAAAGTPGGSGDATLTGSVDLETIAPLLAPYGLSSAKGRLEVDLRAAGFAADPRVSGTAALAAATGSGAKATLDTSRRDPTLIVDLEPLEFPLTFAALSLRMTEGWVAASGRVKARGSDVEFGTVAGEHTGYALAGDCAGHFGLATRGSVSTTLLRTYLGETVTQGPGGVQVRRLIVRGSTVDSVQLDALDGSVGLAPGGLGVALAGINDLRLTGGRVDFRRCGPTECPQAEEGWFVVDVGGLAEASASSQPSTALAASAGTRGRAVAWGRAFVSPALDAAVGTDLEVRLDAVPYRAYDRRGRLEYEFAVSSDNLQVHGGTPLVVDGEATVDRARYVKDAVQGVEILTLIESSSTEVAAPPPELLQGTTFSLRVETDRPLRVENNIASGVEASAVVEVTGTYEDPEFTGRLDVEPGGNVDIPFLTGTYEIQRGRVTLLREFENAEVDVLALRNEPIYIRDQPRRVQLLLGGTLSEIRWSCIADGDASGELDTIRGCTEYLVLGTGDVQVGENDVQRFGAGGLAGVRKPLQVVGHLTEFDVGKRASDAAPRLRTYVPDVKLRLGQIGPELEVATPRHWFDFNYGRATFSFDYTRGYPGFLLRQSREVKVKLQILDPITLEYSRRIRSYLNERIIFDPLEQDIFELRFDVEIPTIR